MLCSVGGVARVGVVMRMVLITGGRGRKGLACAIVEVVCWMCRMLAALSVEGKVQLAALYLHFALYDGVYVAVREGGTN